MAIVIGLPLGGKSCNVVGNSIIWCSYVVRDSLLVLPIWESRLYVYIYELAAVATHAARDPVIFFHLFYPPHECVQQRPLVRQ